MARLVCALLLGLTLLPRAARSADRETALAKSQEATAAYNIGRFEAAARLWEEAYLLIQDSNFLFNIGQSYRLAGRPDSALPAYRAYLRTTSADAPHREQVQRRIVELERGARPGPRSDLAARPPPIEARSAPPVLTAVAPAPPEPRTVPTWPIWLGLAAVVIAGVSIVFALKYDPTTVPDTRLGYQQGF